MTLLHIILAISLAPSGVHLAKQFSPFDEVHELLAFGEQLSVPESDLVVILGNSGVEKGNLIRFVIQDEGLRVKRRGSKLAFESSRNQNRSQFHDALPHFYRDRATGQVLVDVPGFSDSRDPKMDIATAYFSKHVLDQVKKLKLVLVENHANLMEGSDGSGFSKLLRHVAKLVPDIGRIRESLGFVVAKVQNQEGDDGEVMENVLNYITSFKEDLVAQLETQFEFSPEHNETVAMLSVLDAIYANGTAENLALFRRPDQEGIPWSSPVMSQCQRELRVLLFGSLSFYENRDLNFPYAIAVRSRDFVTQTLILSNNQMVSQYLGKVFKEFQDCVEKEVRAKSLVEEKSNLLVNTTEKLTELIENSDLFDSLSSLMALKGKLAFICNAWKNIDLTILDNLLRSTELSYNLAGSSFTSFLNEVKAIATLTATRVQEMSYFYEFAETLNKELQSYHVQIFRKSAHVILTAENFKEFIFNLSKFSIKVANKDRVVSIEPTRKMLSDLNSIISLNLNHTTRLSFNNFGQELIYEGRNLFVSEIVAELSKFQNLENIFLFAYKTIFIDADVSLTNAHLSMAAPRIVVIGENRTFDLKGSDGTNFSESATNAVNNTSEHGSPGEDGHDAGNVLLLSLDTVNADRLSIKSRGGSGGKGQDGGKGRDGGEITPPHFVSLKPELKNGVANWEQVKGQGYSIEHLDAQTVVVTSRQGARPPSGGGHGGAGGSGGQAGNNLILSEGISSGYPNIELRDGLAGEDGMGGKGGQGMHGCAKKIYRGLCKTNHCDIKKLLQRNTENCNCKMHSVQFCEKLPDGKDGLKGFVKKRVAGGEKAWKSGFNWMDLEAKIKNSVLVSEGLQARENVSELSAFVEYSTTTFKTLQQAFRGMHSYKCRL